LNRLKASMKTPMLPVAAAPRSKNFVVRRSIEVRRVASPALYVTCLPVAGSM
jgi:hypothetical protein